VPLEKLRKTKELKLDCIKLEFQREKGVEKGENVGWFFEILSSLFAR